MQGCQVFECYHTAATTVCHHRLTNSVVYTYGSTCMEYKLFLVVFYLHVALQLIACDTGPFHFSLLFGLSFSRSLYGNQLTRLPEGLLNATTQLQHL